MTYESARDPRKPTNRWRTAIWGCAAVLLLTPAIAMQFTRAVAWGPGDFLGFGALLLSACGAYELVARATRRRSYRAGAAVAIATALLLVWANLAVGVVGSEADPVNALFFGVLAVALAGAYVARFRPAGLCWALVATAAVQLALAIGLIAGGRDVGLLVPTAALVCAWLASAWLFRTAARPRRTLAAE